MINVFKHQTNTTNLGPRLLTLDLICNTTTTMARIREIKFSYLLPSPHHSHEMRNNPQILLIPHYSYDMSINLQKDERRKTKAEKKEETLRMSVLLLFLLHGYLMTFAVYLIGPLCTPY